jgi:hypothetical protein
MQSRLQEATHAAATSLVFAIRDCEAGRAMYERICARAKILEDAADCELRAISFDDVRQTPKIRTVPLERLANSIESIERKPYSRLHERAAFLIATADLAANAQAICWELLD